jgi:Ca-activated chloride channel family protein
MAVACLSAADRGALVFDTPRTDEYVSGPILLRAHVEPRSVRPVKVSFYADGRHVCSLDRPPFECPWDAGPAVVEHNLRAVAQLADGSRLVATVRTAGAGYVESVDVDVIQVPVVVTEGGRFVEGLTREAFALREDGRPQRITFFAAADSPLEVVVAIDVSGSMSAALDGVKAAVTRFLRALRPTDSVTLLGFNDTVFTIARNAKTVEERVAAVAQLESWGGTALYDAASRGISMLGRRPGRRALVMFTDGDDKVSRLTQDDVRRKLDSGNVMFYGVAQGRAVDTVELEQVLRQFAQSTGGRAFAERDAAGLDRAFRQIVDELSHHYLLGYTSTNPARDGTWRRVEVDTPGRKLRIRAREGYRAGAK